MICDSIERLDKYASVIAQASEIQAFVSTGRYQNIAVGEWVQLGDALKVILLEKFNYQEGVLETHRIFLDLHVTLEGCDRMKVASYDQLTSRQAYDAEKDFALWEGREQSTVSVDRMHFLYLMPNEAHNNEFTAGGTRKLVFKILNSK